MWTLLSLCALLCALRPAGGATLSITPNRKLSGEPLTGSPSEILAMTLTTDTENLVVKFTAPYFAGESATNRVHLFLADESHKITEVEFTPTASATLRLYWAPFNLLRSVSSADGLATFTASTTLDDVKKTWAGTATIHRDLLPPRISLYNAANVHPGSADSSELQYDNLYAITNYGVAIPDLMVLPRYNGIGPRFLFNNDEGYSKEWNLES